MTYKIDKDIPIPITKRRGRPTKYPFAKMDVGDSVFFPGERIKGNAYMAAINYASGRDVRFKSRTVIEDGVEGIRVWRVK